MRKLFELCALASQGQLPIFLAKLQLGKPGRKRHKKHIHSKGNSIRPDLLLN
jgi:hypothetical protein